MTRNETHETQRVAVLADSQNLYHTARSLHERNIDYAELLDAAVDGRSLTRAIAYVIKANAPEEESFFDALVDIGFETRIKEIRTFGDGSKKADWDVGMSLDAVSLANHVDAVALCTGDGDFTRLCRHLQHEGVRVDVIAFEESTAEDLIAAADGFIDLGSDPDRYLL
ncbi:LabA-like NYN domain-containing protein [Halapricum hydrolyticum]|uniref:NYN domain-containing protein n=1 Tax=Halapricum hydrolyticum TaxID=2979991 RepID=A0AAE3LFJ5_9EURY|nr:NYN domain-containing protein [Halapricum hydrolyticum]MCU4718876.1 NYN domain-containing protein [Halapricum hydrolyticum]MCU4727846.1 NYN domain-containing protein [Halapricum hydrolyticum]